MNTRSKKSKDVYPNSDSIRMEESQSKTRKTTENDTDDAEIVIENFSSPTFNIHIHVPYYDSNNSKLFLPRIQPVINLHFDEIARRLENNINKKSEKSLHKTFQNLLKKISPKFGVVKFHFKNHSEEKDIQEPVKNIMTPCSSRTPSNVMEQNTSINFEKTQITRDSEEIVTKNIRNKTNRSNSKSDINHVPAICTFDKDVKLKNAVVVLTDVCKTRLYKNYIKTNNSFKPPNNESESSCSFTDRVESTCESKECKKNEEISETKTDNNNCISDSFATICNNTNLDKSDKNITYTCNNMLTEKDLSNKSDLEKIYEKAQNLTALVEGWNFSDFLNRFQMKQTENYNNSTIPSNNMIKSEICDIEKDNSFQSNEKSEYLEEDFEKKPFSDVELHVKVNKNEAELNEGDYLDELESASNLCEVPNWSSDDCKNLQEKMRLELLTDWETLKPDLSSITSNAVDENKFEIPETNKNIISNVMHPEVHFELMKEEMKRRRSSFPASCQVQQNLSSEKLDVEVSPSKSKSSPKKLKRSGEQHKKSGEKKIKSSETKDFIPLNSSGPTKFVVASLDTIKSSDEFEAKDFKKKMLFGNRVNRFSRSDELRIYQLKKEAVQKSLSR